MNEDDLCHEKSAQVDQTVSRECALQTSSDRDALGAERQQLSEIDQLISLLSTAKGFVLQQKGRYLGEPLETVAVSRRGDVWTVTNDAGDVLNKYGTWEYEPQPSNRDQDFIERTRTSLHEAMRRAEEYISQSSFEERASATPSEQQGTNDHDTE